MSFVNTQNTSVLDPSYTKIAPAYGLVDIGRKKPEGALGLLTVNGKSLREAFGSLGLGDVNKTYLETALGLIAVGLSKTGVGQASVDTYGREDKISRMSLDTVNSSPAPQAGLVSFELIKTNTYAALFTMTTTGLTRRGGGGSLQIVISSVNIAYYVLTVNSRFAFIAALASAIIGGLQSTESKASLDAVEGKGIDLLVDAIDEILYGGHGDC